MKYLEKSIIIITLAAFCAGAYDMATAQVTALVQEPLYAIAPLIPLIATGISSGISIFKGIQQKNQAKKLERMNKRPEYRISRGTLTNLANAKAMAEQGLPEEVRANYLNQLELGTSSALKNNVLYSGKSSNANSTLRNYNAGIAELAAQDAEAMARNKNVLAEANRDLSAEEKTAFEWNEASKYNENAAKVASLRGAGDSNIFGGLQSALSSVASGALGKLGSGGAYTAPKGLTGVTGKIPSYSTAAVGAGLAENWKKTVSGALGAKPVNTNLNLR